MKCSMHVLTRCVAISILLLNAVATSEPTGPVVQTELGVLRGHYVTVKGTDTMLNAYLGVPFAQPPIGPLRLAPPQPAKSWEGVRDATHHPNVCVQDLQVSLDLAKNMSMKLTEIPEVSEDCLYLNIYTPSKSSENSKLPVMVWIHGGGFSMGGVFLYDVSALAAYQNVVLVEIQYRLGILGFFSTGDEHAPGNMGLLDQVQALHWVQEHIHNFGGDSNSVTVFGESAGGVSVSLLLLSPLSSGLVHGAIAESGVALMEFLYTRDPLSLAKMMANKTNCDSSSSQTITECVKKLSADDIVKFQKENVMIYFAVTIDGQFLPKSAYEIFQSHEINKAPIMLGANNDEGGYLLANFFSPPDWVDGVDREHMLSILASFYPDATDSWISELIADEYLGTSGDRIKIREGYTRMIGDLMFIFPALKTANLHRDAGVPVYFYEFKETVGFLKERRPSFVGSDHGDELAFVFGSCFTESHLTFDWSCTKEEEQLCRTMMQYWGNFAHTRSPNGEGVAHWPLYGPEEDYLSIGMEQVPSQHLRKDRYTFMTQTLPEQIKLHKEKMQQSEKSKTGPVVQIKKGSLRGVYVDVKGKDGVLQAYLGVPFAKPPVGPLRLAPPQPADDWEGVRDATQQPLMCPQDRDMLIKLVSQLASLAIDFPDVSEDCLYLNIYTPTKPAQDAKLPVMVWIHGGGLTSGSASIFDGSALAAYQDVVVVLIQYRLGLLGFLSTGDEHISGNMGLLDQIEALRWVNKNIQMFGGDPNSVTIFGESAGGVSVSLLLLSPLSNGLFHKAIAESGTAAMDLLLTDNPLPFAQMAANASGCDITSTQEIADCFKRMATEDIQIRAKDPTRFSVTIDGHLLTKSVNELFQNQEFPKIPFMTGVNSDEGGWLIPLFFALPEWADGMDREQVMTPTLAMVFPNPEDEFIRHLVADEYLGTSEDREKIRKGFTELLGDILFNIPAIKTANVHRDAGAPVYLYEYQHILKSLKEKRPAFVGSDHGDELVMVFGFCFTGKHVKLEGLCTEDEEELSRTMMSYWGNFARTGSPNGEGLAHWPLYGPEGDYLSIGMEQVPSQHLRKDRYAFMTQTLPEQIRLHKEKMERIEL